MSNTPVRGQVWKHADGGFYTIEYLCKIKRKGRWVDGVVYHPVGKAHPICVRTLKNFLKRFTQENS